MTKFSIPHTAFSGYRLLAARPRAAVAWFIFQLVVTFFSVWVTVVIAGPQLTTLKEMMAGGRPDPATMMALQGQLMPYNLFKIVFPLVTGTILMGAVLRAVLRPARSALGYLRAGGDEMRLLVVNIVVGIFLFVLVVIAYALGMIGLFTSVGPRVAAMAMQGHGTIPLTAMLITGLVALPGVAALLALYVKFSLAGPQTVAERAIRIFGSWGLTRGIFWRTLATYILAAIPAGVAWIALAVVSMSIRAGDGNWMQALQPDVGSMAAAFSVGHIALYVGQALVMTVYTVALLVPAALIYNAVAVRPLETAVDDDDDDDDDED